MKAIRNFAYGAFMLCAAVMFASCSSDNGDEPKPEPTINPSAVLTGGLPKSVADMNLTYTGGLLTKIVTGDGESVTFEYGNKTKSGGEYHVKMIIKYSDSPDDITYMDMTIGDNGFVKNCTQTYADNGTTDTWAFGYTTDSNMNYMKRSEGGNEVTTVTYENGNIKKVSMSSDDADDKLNADIYYTSTETPTAIENKACIMLFDETFSIDMDEMKYAYWAGLLGKATKHLPVKMVYDGDETETFQWQMKNGYPEKLTCTDSGYTEDYFFEW